MTIEAAPLTGYTLGETLHVSRRTRISRAIREADGLPVVLKMHASELPEADEIHRFMREIEIGRLFEDPHVVRYLELVPADHRLVIVEADDGAVGFEQILPEEGLDARTFLELAIQLAKGLGVIHRAGVIHKDVKPANLIVDPETLQIKYIDFGIATHLGLGRRQRVDGREIEGTLAYLSPEQTGRTQRSLDERTDFYALGVTFYQMLTGTLPFAPTDPLELIHDHIAKPPPPPSQRRADLPGAVEKIVLKLMAKSAEERYRGAHGLALDLERCLFELDTAGTVATFVLGEKDLSETFKIPQKLYGREVEIECLLETFDASVDHVEILLVAGEPGVGKSALVQHVYPQICERQARFVGGKYDPHQGNVPYSALGRALDELCKHLLTEDATDLSLWRRRILDAISTSGGALIELVPSLELVTGRLPAPPAVPPREARNRLLHLVQRLLAVFGRSERPLVLFLDDLQWADSASLELLKAVVASENIHHVLILGAFRDTEVDASHPLLLTLSELAEDAREVKLLRLGNLRPVDVEAMVAEALACSLAIARPLAELVYEKTQGNAFFTTEFLKSLDDEGLLRFEHSGDGTPRWRWDVGQIRAKNITDNVVELMAGKIARLAPETQRLLDLAACLGAQFEWALLNEVAQGEGFSQRDAHHAGAEESDFEKRDLLEHLLPAIREGLIIPRDGSQPAHLDSAVHVGLETYSWLKFSHDRVQQAAWSRIPTARRTALHLAIGHRLWAGANDEDVLEGRIFEIVGQLRRAVPLLTDPDERLEVARLELRAGRKAKMASAYASAAKAIRSGIELLPEDAWQTEHQLSFALHRELAETEYLGARFPEAAELTAELLERARSDAERVEARFLELEQLTIQGRYPEVVEAGRETLHLFGVHLPERAEEIEAMLEDELEALGELLAARPIEELASLPPMRGEREIALMRLLPGFATGAYFANRHDMTKWAVTKRVVLCLEHGSHELAPLGYVGYAYNVAAAHLDDYDTAYTLGELGLELAETGGNPTVRGRTRLLFYGGVSHWKRPLGETLEPLREAYRLCLEGGDLTYSPFVICYLLAFRIACGDPLHEIREEADRYLPFLRRTNAAFLEGSVRPLVLQPLASFLGLTEEVGSFDDAAFNEKRFLAGLGRIDSFRAGFYAAKIRTHYLLGQPERALAYFDHLPLVEEALPGMPFVPECLFYAALAFTAVSPIQDAAEHRRLSKWLVKFRERLWVWSRGSPESYLSMALMVDGERARLRDEVTTALTFYNDAVAAAQRSGQVHLEALAQELLGRLWIKNGVRPYAAFHLRRCRGLYVQWGAAAKVAALDRLYPDLAAPFDLASRGGEMQGGIPAKGMLSLDVETVLKASQAISRELRLQELLETVTRIVMENAGAELAWIQLEPDGGDRIEVRTMVGDGEVEVIRRSRDEERAFPEIPSAVLRYVDRVGREVVLGEAARDRRFSSDPEIHKRQVQSLLCMPIIRQRERMGFLYLENNLVSRAFTKDRVSLLHILLAQMAISLENAFLYDGLNREIAAREAHALELEAKNAELERFTYTISHDLKSPLVTIKGFLGLAERDAEAGDRNRLSHDLERIGHAVNTMDQLLRELLELVRIGRVAGEMQGVEVARVVQEALMACAGALEAGEVEVVVRDGLPTVSGDPVRLREVFQNLIENAIKFTVEWAEVPRIEIGPGSVADGARAKGKSPAAEDVGAEAGEVRVYVRDNGPGIEARYHEKIFGLFERLDARREGTGIGLALVKRIVEVHNGRVWVESEGGGTGSTFWIVLPRMSP